MDMPAAIIEYFPGITWGQVSEVVEDYGPVIQVLQHTWSHQTFQEIMQGQVTVPDEVLNNAIAECISDKDAINSLEVHSKENGRLEIKADTKKIGRIELSGNIEEFVHNKDKSSVTYSVRERALKDHGLASWFFSRISLSMAQKLFGKLDFGDNLPVSVKGNHVTVDFSEAIKNSQLGTTKLEGYSISDMVEVQEAVPHDGYITLKTKLNIPDEIKTMVLNVLQ